MTLHYWPKTNITSLFNIQFPIIQAPMAGGATTPELVAAVSNSGGLGSFAAGYLTAHEMIEAIRKIRKLTDKPFSVNLFIPQPYHVEQDQMNKACDVIQEACHELHCQINSIQPPYTPSFEEQMDVIIKEKIPVFSYTFGIPTKNWIDKLKVAGIKIIGTATSLEEAILLQENRVDAIVVQGSEAGGHRGTFLGEAENSLTNLSNLMLELNNQINIPLIAAGGIMNGNDVYKMMQLGASGVQLGTAFLCCQESGIHPLYKQALLHAKHDMTVLTRAFSGKLARGITNTFISRMKNQENTILDYPIQHALTLHMRKEASKKNMIEFMSMWAGQGMHFSRALPAADLIYEILSEIKMLNG